jgi:hypothetical protein
MDIGSIVVPQQVVSVAPAVVVKIFAERYVHENREGHTDDTLRIKSINYLTR